MHTPQRNTADDEWRVIESLLPDGWRQAAHRFGAFLRARYLKDPSDVLRLILFHAVNDGGLRESVSIASASGLASMTAAALFKRLRTAGDWLAWICAELCRQMRDSASLPGLRLRVVDSTTVQVPASRGTDWRLHYAMDLGSCSCDWFELTDATQGERLDRTPVAAGDVILADRGYLSSRAVWNISAADAHVLIRMRWKHPRMLDQRKRVFHALTHARRVRVGEVRAWDVTIQTPHGPIAGRVVATKLPAPLVARGRERLARVARKKMRQLDKRTLEAAQLVMLFTTVPKDIASDQQIMELYRYRWQVELAFKRHKQLLGLGQVPHKDPAVARSWILAKLVVALLLEKLYRDAQTFSPWGYQFNRLRPVSQ
jgi:IS4 transposase